MRLKDKTIVVVNMALKDTRWPKLSSLLYALHQSIT